MRTRGNGITFVDQCGLVAAVGSRRRRFSRPSQPATRAGSLNRGGCPRPAEQCCGHHPRQIRAAAGMVRAGLGDPTAGTRRCDTQNRAARGGPRRAARTGVDAVGQWRTAGLGSTSVAARPFKYVYAPAPPAPDEPLGVAKPYVVVTWCATSYRLNTDGRTRLCASRAGIYWGGGYFVALRHKLDVVNVDERAADHRLIAGHDADFRCGADDQRVGD